MRSIVFAVLLLLAVSACSDPPASAAAASESGTAACTDQADNDNDGHIDCADQDCWELVACADGGAAVDVETGDALESPPDTLAQETSTTDSPDVQASLDIDESDDGPPSNEQVCEPCGYGTLTGKVCAPNEQVFVNNASVTIETTDCAGQPLLLETTSDLNGIYHFEQVPCGNHVVKVVKGSFKTEYVVALHPDEHTDLSAAVTKICFGAASAKIAVLDGSYDNIEGLLDQLGFDYDLYSEGGIVGDGDLVELLSSPTSMAQYEIIFANCGVVHGWMPQDHADVMPNVQNFILNGGSFYMSDYAWVYGEYAFPDAIEFMRDDDVTKMYQSDLSPQMIQSDQTVTGIIADGALAGWLGKTELQITFDNGPQIAPEKAGPGTIPHVSAKMNQLAPPTLLNTIPLVLSYKPEPDAGRVIYTNFHNDAQATGDMLKVIEYLVFTL